MRKYTDQNNGYDPYNNYGSYDDATLNGQMMRDKGNSRSGRKKKRNNRNNRNHFFNELFTSDAMDSYLFLVIIFLTAIGLVMILSSSYYTSIEKFGTGYHYFQRQFMWSIFGICVLLFISKINYKVIKKFSMLIYVVSLILLVLVIVIGIADKGAQRWLEIGGVNFQPSEIAKIGLIASLALMLAKRKDYEEYELPKSAGRMEKIWHSTVGIWTKEWALILLPVCLIVAENWSTAAVVLATGVIMITIAGFKLERWSLVGVIILIMGICAIKAGGIDYLQDLNLFDGKYNRRLQRLETWIDPFEDPLDTGFQTVQSLYAIGSGGITGVGLGKSKQKLGYLPESHNDMIFTIVCEEFGLIGAVVVLGLFAALIVKCVQIALHAPDRYSMFFVMGMISLIALQVIINVGVVTGVLPNTGMPLPFISYGGTSLLFTMVGMGIVLNISRYSGRR